MQLNLPVQGAVERRTGFYQPYTEIIAVYTYSNGRAFYTKAREHAAPAPPSQTPPDGKGEKTGYLVGEPPPAYNFGTDVGDPAFSEEGDSRGWQCDPGAGCEWNGLV
ncbi:hypothetical protein [Streptomyces sp. NBC_00299]|uniref:hypothetical protein n=1 Tax=Streptomyces sp. NBC_00299 TaxID=2975705 RepID=UPI002E285E6A|nr:hypothetical protein [Streptomyces sp. NBC_00299]